MAHVQAAYFTERDIAEKQRDSFYNPADPWDNGDISFTGGIQPLMVNALTDEGAFRHRLQGARADVEVEQTGAKSKALHIHQSPSH